MPVADVPESTKNRAAFALAASKIDRDARLSDLTDAEIDALIASTRAAPPAMDREAVRITQREIDALRYLLNWDGTGKRVSSVMKTFTLNGDERSYTKDALESLWAKLSTLSADAIRQGEGWRLVPTVMTPEMIEAWRSAPGLDCQAAYTAMLAATPASHASDGGEGVEKDVAFLREAARYFANRPTDGEDRAHWSNIANSESCERIANRLSAWGKGA